MKTTINQQIIMNIDVKYAYANKVTRNSNRLNLLLNEIIKNNKGDKSYITHSITLWDDMADKYEKKLVVGEKGGQQSTCVYFSGYVTKIDNFVKDGDKVFTTLFVNLNKAANSFGIVGETAEVAEEEEEENLFA